MKAVIFCGGKGTRIREVSELLPKPMLPIGSLPILWHILKIYRHHGIREFILCLGFQGSVIKQFFLNYAAMVRDVVVDLRDGSARSIGNDHLEDWSITLADTGENSGTAERLRAVRHYLEGESTFLLTYGDGVGDIDVRESIAFHHAKGRIMTVTAVRPPGRFGELDVDEGLVRQFNEKPQTSEGLINGGFFVCDAKRIWPYLEDLPATGELEIAPMQRLARDGELAAFIHPGFWHPMDTSREHAMLNQLWVSGTAPWRVW